MRENEDSGETALSRRLQDFQTEIRTVTMKGREADTERYTAVALFETLKFDAKNRRDRRESLSVDERAQLVEQITGPLRPGAYIEIGCGARPYVDPGLYGATKRQFTEESPYIGFDRRDDYHSHMNGIAQVRERLQGVSHVEIVTGVEKIEDLELPDHEAQEVFMGDVLLEYNATPEERYDLLKTAKRLLRPDGMLIIGGTSIGHVAGDGNIQESFGRNGPNIGEVALLLDELGFTKRMMVDTNMAEGQAINEALGWHGENFMVARIPELPDESAEPETPIRRGLLSKLGISKPKL